MRTRGPHRSPAAPTGRLGGAVATNPHRVHRKRIESGREFVVVWDLNDSRLPRCRPPVETPASGSARPRRKEVAVNPTRRCAFTFIDRKR